MVLGLGGLVVLYFIIAILPLFVGLYGELNLSVPTGLSLMMILRRTLTDHPLVLVFVMLGLVIFHHGIRPYRLRLFLVIPPCQRAYGRFWEVRFVGLLALLLESDLSLHEALEEARNLLPKGPLRLEGQKLLRAVTSGDSFSEAALTAPLLISPLTRELLSMGEESGRLPQCLARLQASDGGTDLDPKDSQASDGTNPFGFYGRCQCPYPLWGHVPPNGPYEWAAYSYIVQKGRNEPC